MLSYIIIKLFFFYFTCSVYVFFLHLFFLITLPSIVIICLKYSGRFHLLYNPFSEISMSDRFVEAWVPLINDEFESL